jgi:mRNA interferase HigB
VRVISQRVLREFWERHPAAEEPLRKWFRTALAAKWANLSDVRRIFPHADGVDGGKGVILTIFNIGGNKYRLVARIRYGWQLINVRCVLTHAEYDKQTWKD